MYFKHLRAQLVELGVDVEGKYNDELLVYIHGLSHQDFIANHSLIPYHRAVRDPLPPFRSARRTRPASIAKTSRNGAWFCPDCALEDMRSDGFSCWRRAHQLIGVDRCPKHRDTPLRMLDSLVSFAQQPHLNIDRGIPATYSFTAKSKWDLIFRFAEISIGLLGAAYPKSPKAAQSLIGDLAIASGVYEGKIFVHPELLRYATEVLPREWLLANFPGIYQKLNWRCSFDYKMTADYALALALVSDSADIALSRWENLPTTTE